MPFLHLDRKWKRLWKAFAAKKVCLCQETVVGTKYPDNEKKTRSAAECADLLLYPCESDTPFFQSLDKEVRYQPFAVDDLVFRSTTPWEERNPVPLFFGKVEVPGNAKLYEERREWLKKISPATKYDVLPYRRRLAARRLSNLLNERKWVIEPPSEFQGRTTRHIEAAGCGCLIYGKEKVTTTGALMQIIKIELFQK
jgi:hypothetical protein